VPFTREVRFTFTFTFMFMFMFSPPLPPMIPQMMIAHLVQTDIAWEDRRENHRRVERMLRESSAIRPGDLVALPEMFDTGFSFDLAKTADTDSMTLDWIRATAKAHQITLHGARTVLGPDGRGRNRATIAGPDGQILCEYDKVHPFNFGREGEFFTGGSEITTYTWANAHGSTTVCPVICYDLRFPELFRTGMTLGAEVFVVIANWPAPRKLHRSVLAQARAIENQACVLSVNRTGSDPNASYVGGTVAFSSQGDALGELDDGPGILTVNIDLAALRAWREKFPALRDAKLLNPPPSRERAHHLI
jgi:omega-amidase